MGKKLCSLHEMHATAVFSRFTMEQRVGNKNADTQLVFARVIQNCPSSTGLEAGTKYRVQSMSCVMQCSVEAQPRVLHWEGGVSTASMALQFMHWFVIGKWIGQSLNPCWQWS